MIKYAGENDNLYIFFFFLPRRRYLKNSMSFQSNHVSLEFSFYWILSGSYFHSCWVWKFWYHSSVEAVIYDWLFHSNKCHAAHAVNQLSRFSPSDIESIMLSCVIETPIGQFVRLKSFCTVTFNTNSPCQSTCSKARLNLSPVVNRTLSFPRC